MKEEEEFDCSYHDPHLEVEKHLESSSDDKEVKIEEGFMSGQVKGVKRRRGSAASVGAAATGPGSSLTWEVQAQGGVRGVLAAHPPPWGADRAGVGSGKGGVGWGTGGGHGRGRVASSGAAGAGSSLTGAGQAGVGVSGVLAAHPTPGEAVRARDGRGRAGRGGIVS